MIDHVILKDAEKGLGARLRQTRHSAGLTQTQLAVRAGTNQAVIQKIENGNSRRPRVLVDIAVVLDVNPAWLQMGDLCAGKEMPEVEIGIISDE